MKTEGFGESVIARLQRNLLSWYRRNRRALPWRAEQTLYGTWISEIMLQQTTVRAVIPYWHGFLQRFPDVQSLAAASEQSVLAAWSGLGYYRRARHLHAAARQIVAHGGQLPADLAGWRALPGIGDYTAGAIVSIGLGEPATAIDANARRVLSRWLSTEPEQAAALGARALAQLARPLIPRECPGDWTQAVMELGALICTPAAPRCAECPVADHCRARRADRAAEIPPLRPRPAIAPVELSVLIIRRAERILLLPPGAGPAARLQNCGRPLRRDFSGLFAGLWGLPSTPWYADRPLNRAIRIHPAAAHLAAWSRWLVPGAAAPTDGLRDLGQIRHAITIFRLRVRVIEFAADISGWDPPVGALWCMHPGQDQLPLSSLARKSLALAERAC